MADSIRIPDKEYQEILDLLEAKRRIRRALFSEVEENAEVVRER